MNTKMNAKQRDGELASGTAQRAAAAHCACLILVEAYKRGEASSGSVDWEDLDRAHEKALLALTAIERRRIQRRVGCGSSLQEV